MNKRLIFFYALPGVVLGMPTIPVYVHLPQFYAETLGLGLTVTGAALFLARIGDALSDPVAGWLSDRVPSRFGRRKPWIALGFPIAALGLVQLLIPPEGAGTSYLIAWAVVLYVGWTFVSVPYTAWAAELSGDYHGRSQLTGAREGAMILGVLLAAVLPVLPAIGSKADGLAAVAWVAVILGVPAMGLLLAKVPDRPRVEAAKGAPRAGWASFTGNKPFLRLIAAWAVNGLANGIPAALFTLYMTHGLRAGEDAQGGLILAYFLAAVLAVPAWVRVSKRVGKHRTWCVAMGMACLAFVCVPAIPPGGVTAFLIVCIVTGAALGADLAMPPSMQADVVDYDRLKTGHARAGLFFALWSTVTKLAAALSIAIALPGVAALGFDPETVTDHGLLALVLMYAALPVALKMGAMALVWGHPLDARRQGIIARRLERAEGPE